MVVHLRTTVVSVVRRLRIAAVKSVTQEATRASLTQYVCPSRCSAFASSMLFSDTRWPAVTRDVDLSARTVSATCLAVQLSTALRARTPDGGPTCQTSRKHLSCLCREEHCQETHRCTECESSAPTWKW